MYSFDIGIATNSVRSSSAHQSTVYVLSKSVFTELVANARLLEPAQWRCGAEKVVTVDPNRASLDSVGSSSDAIDITAEYS